MRHNTLIPRTRTLLAGAMAALAGGQALAETAGRVSFVNGSVSATSPDGQSRALRRGDAINGGDRIETRSGRLQIRFTDGGFVSLQPNTVFGVDQYLYANKAPEETSLFFSLLRGGMRTVTGAIGKVNKQSYKVRTPVATIGIRGTGYLAETNNERTLVSVGAGLVFVENSFGNATGSAGQSIEATLQRPPQLTREAPEIRATRPEGDGAETEDTSLASTAANEFGDQILPDGTPLLLAPDPLLGGYLLLDPVVAPLVKPLADTDVVTGTPQYSLASPMLYVDGPDSLMGLFATFNQTSTDPLLRGGLLTLADPASSPANILLDSGTLTFNMVTVLNGLSWGEFTNGAAATDSVSFGNLTALSSTEFMPYIIGTASTSLLSGGTAKYTLMGHTMPTLDRLHTAGTAINSFKIDIDFDFGLMDLALDLSVSAVPGDVKTINVAQNDISIAGSFASKEFNLVNLTGTGTACISGCSASISGFFSGVDGANLGTSYSISSDLGIVQGVAALSTFNNVIARADTAPLPDMQVYTLSTTAASVIYGGYPTDPAFTPSLLADFDASGALVSSSLTSPSTLDVLSNNITSPALVADVGTFKTLSWGRYHSGTIDVLGSPTVLSGSNSAHYIIGEETPSSTMSSLFAQGGTATYALSGHTTGTFYDPTGVITSSAQSMTGTLTADFLNSTLGVAMNWSMTSGSAYVLNSSIGLNGSAQFSASGLTTTGSGGACASTGCSTRINGFFSGQQAEQIGLTYVIQDDMYSVNGAASFQKQ